MRFKDKVCLVTGGGSGIGRASCERFAREGGKVVVVDLKEEHGQETVQAIDSLHGEAIFAKADVGDAEQIKASIVPYATSKGGMEAFVRGFSEEIATRKIRINCVAPGAVDTPMLWNNPNVKSGLEKVVGAIGKPEDLAAAICFLASDEARFITGTTLIVDGGRLDILN